MASIINASTSTGLVTTADTSGVLQLQTGGTAAVTVDASQNVGIGTASPNQRLQINNPSAASSLALFTNANTGSTGNDGSYCGIDTTGNMYVWNQENLPMLFGTNNGERMRIDSSGNVGIGTSSPEAPLHVAKSASGGDGGYLYLDNPAASTLNNKAGIRFATSGGGSFASTPTGEITNLLTDGSTAASALTFGTFNGSASGERMRITSGGDLLVGTTSNGLNVRLNVLAQNVSSPAAIGAQVGTNGAYALAVQNASGTNVGGVIANASTTSYATSSDYRLKENIAPMTGALAKVAQLNPVTYTWKSDGSASEGFIAHELQAVVPECVVGEKDAVDAEGNPRYQGVDTSFLVATLTAAIQEQQAIIQTLTDRITALEGTTP